MTPRAKELQTERLRLRAPRAEDAAAVFANWTSDPEVTRYLTWRPHADVGVTRAWLRASARAWAEEDASTLVWLLEQDAEPVGAIGLTFEGHRASIGYVLSRSRWGRGLMSEAAATIARHASALEGVQRVWSICDVDNRASARVLVKSGLELEGILRRWVVHPGLDTAARDVEVYSLP